SMFLPSRRSFHLISESGGTSPRLPGRQARSAVKWITYLRRSLANGSVAPNPDLPALPPGTLSPSPVRLGRIRMASITSVRQFRLRAACSPASRHASAWEQAREGAHDPIDPPRRSRGSAGIGAYGRNRCSSEGRRRPEGTPVGQPAEHVG